MTSSVFAGLLVLTGTDLDVSENAASPLKLPFYLVGIFLFLSGQSLRYFSNSVRNKNGKPKVPSWISLAYLIALAKTEAVAILGVVIGLLGGSTGEYLPLFALSALGMIFLFPASFFRVESVIAKK